MSYQISTVLKFRGLFKEHYAVHEIFSSNRLTNFGLDIMAADTLKQTSNLPKHTLNGKMLFKWSSHSKNISILSFFGRSRDM